MQGCLPTVAGPAKGLPVAGITEQGWIALVGDYVVRDCRGDHPPLFQALDAQGIAFEVSLRGDAPLAAVATGSRVPAPPVVLVLLLFPVEVAPGPPGSRSRSPGNCRDVLEQRGSRRFPLVLSMRFGFPLPSGLFPWPDRRSPVLEHVSGAPTLLPVHRMPVRAGHVYVAALFTLTARNASSTSALRHSSERREWSRSDSKPRVRSTAGFARPEQSRPRALRKALV